MTLPHVKTIGAFPITVIVTAAVSNHSFTIPAAARDYSGKIKLNLATATSKYSRPVEPLTI